MKWSKFIVDLTVNYLSLILLACSGILINLLIVEQYGPATLGQFNLVFAGYIIISQFSTLGVHYSVLRNLALSNHNSPSTISQIVTASLVLVAMISLFVSVFTYHLAPFIGSLYQDHYITFGFRALSYAIPLFALNKVLLAALNGKRHMKLFSIGQALRYLMMLLFTSYISLKHHNPLALSYVFLCSEMILFCALLYYTYFHLMLRRLHFKIKWVIQHFQFGAKAFLSGVFLEANSRIELMILAYLVSSTEVGTYSFAAMIAEGFSMILVVVRNHANPVIAHYLSDKKFQELSTFMKQIRNYTYLLMSLLILVVFGGYLILTRYILNVPQLIDSWPVLFVLLICIFIASGYLPFTDFLTQANAPKLQSFQNMLVLFSNIILNLILIPKFGMLGAALSAGLSTYIISLWSIDFLARKQGMMFIRLNKMNLNISPS